MITFAMLRQTLELNPDCALQFVFNDGGAIPPHFHVTEVGHVTKDFIDCGGTWRTTSACVLQTLVAHDTDHRLTSTRLASILALTGAVLPSAELPVEVEHDEGTTAIYSLGELAVENGQVTMLLEPKHTACLAPDKCGLEETPAPDDSGATACAPSANC